MINVKLPMLDVKLSILDTYCIWLNITVLRILDNSTRDKEVDKILSISRFALIPFMDEKWRNKKIRVGILGISN